MDIFYLVIIGLAVMGIALGIVNLFYAERATEYTRTIFFMLFSVAGLVTAISKFI